MLSGPNGPVFADLLGKPDLITHLGRSTGTPEAPQICELWSCAGDLRSHGRRCPYTSDLCTK